MNRYVDSLEAAWQDHLVPRMSDAPTVISTFAGCGGSSLGYSMAGFRELLAVEWDANAAATFHLNFPDVPIYQDDIAGLSVDACCRLAGILPGQLDVLDGSPPCQGFSTAGKRHLHDARNDLFREFVRMLEELQPRTFVMENVSGMVKGKMKLVFVECLQALKAAEYRVSARLMNAKYFGVPQSRERMIFVGVRNDLAVAPSHPIPMHTPICFRESVIDLLSHDQVAKLPTSLRAQRWRETPRGDAHHERFALLRLSWNTTPPTILRVPGSGGHMHPDEPRLLSVGELKRIASFPDAFRFAGTWNNAVSCIGNSVPPLFMRAIAQHLRQTVLDVERREDAA